MTSLVICWLYWMNLHQTFSLLGHTAVRRHQTLALRTYSTPRRGLDAKLNMSTWLNLTSTSLLARALITNAGCMTERPKLSHNRESRRGSPTMPMIQLPLLTIDLTADRGSWLLFFFLCRLESWLTILLFFFLRRFLQTECLSFPRIHSSGFKQRNRNGDDCICLLGVTIAICPTVIISFQCVCQN